MEKTCLHCKRRFNPHPAVRRQQYCGNPECQKARKRKWQKEKLASDRDYRTNQASAQKQWRSRNQGYCREYRRRNSVYTERNRVRQRERNGRRRAGSEIAKMDEHQRETLVPSGRYRLVPVCNTGIAKMDELIVELGVISRSCGVDG